MDSGIYQLTFSSGDTYVGKSLHLTMRYKQHADKLSRGTAAKNMLRAYYQSDHQYPSAEVLVYCHPNLLDEYENYWINYLKPTLNTQIPPMMTEREQLALIRHMERGSATYSVPTLLIVVEEFVEDNKNLKQKISELESDYETLDTAWNSRAIRDARAMREYQTLEINRDNLCEKVRLLELFKFRVTNATWWQRLWRTW
jgi:hypothetical protein